MEKTTIANEKTNRFFVRLRRIPGEHWYLATNTEKNVMLDDRVKVPDDIKAQDFLIDQISFFNKQIWYHFTRDDLVGWLPKRNIRKTFRRLAVQPVKQATQSDIDNECAAVKMLLTSANASITDEALKAAVEKWRKQSDNLIDLSELIISQTHSIRDLSRANFRQLNKQLLRRRPVVIKVAGLDNLKSSLIVLTGFNRKLYYYNDPWTGRLESISQNHLRKHWKRGNLEAISC
ncbi:hypothetical protein KOM07_02090 [Lentilactobacillus sp. G22-6]|uniref:papain-like cysteine protease family protein n=1 Tax=Lentilactobacillus dabitei TaxID=2831523 RepID=UPI001C263818|nr:papain-like cysteine protease family protein [Lentilactobacillus dabitei]MBU9788356.1 hypothetical protein [Lentilactobacillus dabitei]